MNSRNTASNRPPDPKASGARVKAVRDGHGALVVALEFPHPPRGGGDLRRRQTVRALAAAGDVTVVTLAGEAAGEAVPDAVARHMVGDPALIAQAKDSLTWLRDPSAHPADRWFSPTAVEKIARLAGEVSARVVVLEQLVLHSYIAPLRELGCRVVLDAHDIEADLSAELAARHRDPISATLARRTAAIESAAFAAADAVWVCSSDDERRARARYRDCAPIMVVPNAVEVDRYPGAARQDAPATLLYPGAFIYPPNATAAARLIEEIFPPFAERVPDARLVLLGSNPTPSMVAAAGRDARIEVTGAVADVTPHLARATVMPIPLAEGGGTRFKVLEAFASGLAVVSTAKGVEGLDVSAGEHYLAAETGGEFVEALVTLCSAPARRRDLAERALSLVNQRYSMAAAADHVLRALG